MTDSTPEGGMVAALSVSEPVEETRTKKCSICKLVKPFSDYFRCKKSRLGVSPNCKACYQERYAPRFAEWQRSDVFKERRSRRVRDRRDWLDAIKVGAGCLFCTERDACCLQLHRLRDKVFTISANVNGTPQKLIDEIKKCVVVCANCHIRLHAGLVEVPPDTPHPTIPDFPAGGS